MGLEWVSIVIFKLGVYTTLTCGSAQQTLEHLAAEKLLSWLIKRSFETRDNEMTIVKGLVELCKGTNAATEITLATEFLQRNYAIFTVIQIFARD